MTRSAILLSVILIFTPLLANAKQSPAPIDATTYPRKISNSAGTVLIHHPIIEDWRDFEVVSGWAPVEVTPAGSDRSWLGSLHFEVDTEIHLDEHLVSLHDGRVLEVKFTDGQPGPAVTDLARNAAKSGAQSVVLDFLIRALPQDYQIPGAAKSPPHLNFSPPRIVISKRPMDLLLIDGPPSTAPISPGSLEYVVNTNWYIFHHSKLDRWYILKDGFWLENSMLGGGDWNAVTELPDDFMNLQVNSEWEYVGQFIPPRKPESEPLPLTISYEPTELVVIDGEAQLEEIAGTGIRYVTNTESDLFTLDDQYYLLVSGRWFRTKNIKKKWYAAKPLPAAFANIPPDHAKAYVLASVPGTPQARVAMIQAAIPRVVEHDLTADSDVGVEYAGEPNFVPIEGTELLRADNTPYQVFRHNNFYYLCHDGAWFSSTQPGGPWRYAVEVPEEIYSIPPTDPAFNVTFVKVKAFDDSSKKVAYVQTNGYQGRYSTGSSVVYGTGWYYPGTIHYYPNRYPVYGHYPRSYGYGAVYHPAYGRYHRRGAYWGHYPYPMHVSATYDTTIREKDWEWDLNGNKRQVYAQGDPNYVGSGTYQMNGAKDVQAPGKQTAPVDNDLSRANNGKDDLYSGPDGEVYRKTAQGWQQYQGNGWVTVPGAGQEYLDRQFNARQKGYQNYEERKQDSPWR